MLHYITLYLMSFTYLFNLFNLFLYIYIFTFLFLLNLFYVFTFYFLIIIANYYFILIIIVLTLFNTFEESSLPRVIYGKWAGEKDSKIILT